MFQTFYISLLRESVRAAESAEFSTLGGAIWPTHGEATVAGMLWQVDTGVLVKDRVTVTGISDAGWLRFDVSCDAPVTIDGREIILCEQAELQTGPVLLRLDEVNFPPAAIAYRHIHPGPGIRYLRTGQLHLQSDHDAFLATPGKAWFEAANSPVRATADANMPKTRFVRFMALPAEFEGEPTIQILDAADLKLPRLQTTHRHFDHIVQLG